MLVLVADGFALLPPSNVVDGMYLPPVAAMSVSLGSTLLKWECSGG